MNEYEWTLNHGGKCFELGGKDETRKNNLFLHILSSILIMIYGSSSSTLQNIRQTACGKISTGLKYVDVHKIT